MRAPSSTRLASLVYGFPEGLAHQDRRRESAGFVFRWWGQNPDLGVRLVALNPEETSGARAADPQTPVEGRKRRPSNSPAYFGCLQEA
jgi:hypothetical protein